MLDKKIKIAFEDAKLVELESGIKVKPYLSRDDQEVLRTVYMSEYFSDNDSHVLNAEYSLLSAMLELCTNIQLYEDGQDGKVKAVIKIDDLFANYGLIKSIKASIQNHGEFRALLRQSVDDEKERRKEQYAMGKVLSELSEKAVELLNSFLDFDTSDESMAKIRELVGQVEKSPIINEALKIFKENNEKGTKEE